MAETILKTRILLKSDTTENWEKAANSFIPKKGEVCVYLDRIQLEDGSCVPGIKVGDGSSYVNELEFMGEEYITKEEIDTLLDFNGNDEPSGGTIPLVTLTFPLLDQNTLQMGDINSTDIFYFSTLSNKGEIIIEYQYFWDVCLYEDKRTIQVIPNTLLTCHDSDWNSFKCNKNNAFIVFSAALNGHAASVVENAVLEWDGPT